MIYPTLPELLHVAERTLGTEVPVRDHGLLEAALARPQASAFGADANEGLEAKAGAMLHSLARHHALVEGNKRLALHDCVLGTERLPTHPHQRRGIHARHRGLLGRAR